MNRLLPFFLLLLLCSSASAGLLASVSPKDPGLETLGLYLNEAADYELTVFNDGPNEVTNVLLKVTATEGLKIVDKGIEKSALSMTIASIGANARESVLLKLKPTELSEKNLFLYVDYGVGQYTHLSATYLSVEESPLQVNTSLSSTSLDVGGEGSIKLSLKNNSQEPVRNIRAELFVFEGLESLDGVVSVASLAPGEGYEAKEFLFRADPGVTGEKHLALQVSFEDRFGRHVIEKNFSIEIQSKQAIFYLIVAIIILLIGVAFLSRGKDSKAVKKLEKPLAHELESKHLTPGKK